MHSKAALVLKEAAELQENVLGNSHSTVLSTLDNLADSLANSGQATEALRTYRTILERFHAAGNKKTLRPEAVLLFKMSCVYRSQHDRDAQLDALKRALRAVRAEEESEPDSLERRIQYDIKQCRDDMEKASL